VSDGGSNGHSVMDGPDERVVGRLTRRLTKLARKRVDPDDLLDPDDVPLVNENGVYEMPDCARCTDRCCIHKEVGSGILLSLIDVANLVDSGLGDLIVGTFTFKKKNGRVVHEIDEMPRLAKRQGNCVFYDEAQGLCTGYEHRPTICRRFPYEVHYEKRTKAPFARYIPDVPCAKVQGKKYLPAIQKMVREAVVDENVSYEDAVLLPDHHDELRKIGFERFLPPPEECPR